MLAYRRQFIVVLGFQVKCNCYSRLTVESRRIVFKLCWLKFTRNVWITIWSHQIKTCQNTARFEISISILIMSVFVVTFFYDIISRTRFVCTLFLLLNLINRKISVYTKHMTSKVEPIRNNSLHFVQKNHSTSLFYRSQGLQLKF
jgi:hypothetical protein